MGTLELTTIGRMKVEVRNAKFLSIVDFAGGAHGKGERGHFAFWTAVLKSKPGKGVTGRARLTLAPGERFDRIRRAQRHKRPETAKAYRRFWKMLNNNIAYVRPSTIREINMWAKGHMPDWQHASHATVAGKRYSK